MEAAAQIIFASGVAVLLCLLAAARLVEVYEAARSKQAKEGSERELELLRYALEPQAAVGQALAEKDGAPAVIGRIMPEPTMMEERMRKAAEIDERLAAAEDS